MVGAVTHECTYTTRCAIYGHCVHTVHKFTCAPPLATACVARSRYHDLCMGVCAPGATIKSACLTCTCTMPVSFTDLPHDVLIKILCDCVLNDADVTHCGVTCRRLHPLATHDTVWHRRYVHRYVCVDDWCVHKWPVQLPLVHYRAAHGVRTLAIGSACVQCVRHGVATVATHLAAYVS